MQTPHQMTRVSECPVCGGTIPSTASAISTKDPFKVSHETFHYEPCSCGSWILNPRPEMSQMGKFYESDFLFVPKQDTKKLGFMARLASKVQAFNLISEVRMLCHALPREEALVLDYSAGNGQILEAVKSRAPKIHCNATEFSAAYREYITDLLPGAVVKDDLSKYDESQKFDVISAFGVLEHVEFPRQLIEDFHNRLNKGGLVVLSVPNVQALQRYLFGARWYNWLAPRHWQMYSMRSLGNMVESADFEIITRKNFFLRTASGSFVLSMFPQLDPLQESKTTNVLLYAILFYLFLPVEFFLSLFGKSGFIGIVARKN